MTFYEATYLCVYCKMIRVQRHILDASDLPTVEL